MQFLHLGTTVTLFGMHRIDLTFQESDHFFRKPVRKGILLQIVSLGPRTSSSLQQCDPLIENLLTELASVFDTPSSLPPWKGHEHQILLMEETALICQRSYRYPHFQKTEIEKIVTNLLEVPLGLVKAHSFLQYCWQGRQIALEGCALTIGFWIRPQSRTSFPYQ